MLAPNCVSVQALRTSMHTNIYSHSFHVTFSRTLFGTFSLSKDGLFKSIVTIYNGFTKPHIDMTVNEVKTIIYSNAHDKIDENIRQFIWCLVTIYPTRNVIKHLYNHLKA